MRFPLFIVASMLTLAALSQDDLDQDGSFYLRMDADTFVKKVRRKYDIFTDAILAKQKNKSPERIHNVRGILQLTDLFFAESGLAEITGIGASAKEVHRGVHRNHLAVYHKKGGGKGELWQILARKPRDLQTLRLLPASTSAAVGLDIDIGRLWQWFVGTCRKNDAGDLGQKLLGLLSLVEALGVDLNSVMKSLDGQFTIAITLDDSIKVNVPDGDRILKIPQPGFVVLAKVKDKQIFKTAERFIQERQVPIRMGRIDSSDNSLYSFANIAALRVNIGLAMTQYNDWLILASSPDLVKNVIAIERGKRKGLAADKIYKKMSRRLPEKGNAFLYISPRQMDFAATVFRFELRKRMSEADSDTILKLTGLDQDVPYLVGIGRRSTTGYQLQANSNIPLNDALLTSMFAASLAGYFTREDRATRPGGDRHDAHIETIKKINIAIMLYTTAHKGYLPKADGAAGLRALLEEQEEFQGDFLISPFDTTRKPGSSRRLSEADTSFLFLGGELRTDDDLGDRTPILIDKPGLNPHGVAVLFLDGHVEFLQGRFTNSQAVIEELVLKHKIPHQRRELLLKKLSVLKAR